MVEKDFLIVKLCEDVEQVLRESNIRNPHRLFFFFIILLSCKLCVSCVLKNVFDYFSIAPIKTHLRRNGDLIAILFLKKSDSIGHNPFSESGGACSIL